MNIKKMVGLISILAVISVPFIYNSCGEYHSEGSFNASSTAANVCMPLLAPAFEPYYGFLQPRCNNCHFSGSGSAPNGAYFADGNFDLALIGFITTGEDKVYTTALNPAHYSGVTGPQNESLLAPLKEAWEASQSSYESCLANVGDTGSGPGGGGIAAPTRATLAKTVPAAEEPVDMEWNLGSEMQNPAHNVTGASMRITVQAVTSSTGLTSYYLSNPRFQGGQSALRIKNIQIAHNGTLVPIFTGGGTWVSVNDLAPVGRFHDIPRGTGTMILPANTSQNNTLSIAFEDLRPSVLYPDFNPVTYATLISTNNNIPAVQRVFSQNCTSCHGAGGVSAGVLLLTPASRGLLLGNQVIPYSPQSSLLHSRINLAAGQNGVMPPTGPLSNEQIRFIRDWILDGAR